MPIADNLAAAIALNAAALAVAIFIDRSVHRHDVVVATVLLELPL